MLKFLRTFVWGIKDKHDFKGLKDAMKLDGQSSVILVFILKKRQECMIFLGKKEVVSIARDHFGFFSLKKNYF